MSNKSEPTKVETQESHMTYEDYRNNKVNAVMRAYGLSEFARKSYDGAIEKVWAKDLEEAERIVNDNQKPYDPLQVSNELYRNGKISAANAL